MRRFHNSRKWLFCTAILAGLLMAGQSAMALDAPHSRKGPFAGIGLGGGGALILGDDDSGAGELGMNLQLGLGATENLTISLNLDNRLQIGNDLSQGMIIPGPKFAVFLTRGIYVTAGVGLALGLKLEPDNDNAVGMNTGIAAGYEHFINTNIAAYISGGIDYSLLNDADDILAFTIALGIRYY